jgi:hypothetical protein
MTLNNKNALEIFRQPKNLFSDVQKIVRNYYSLKILELNHFSLRQEVAVEMFKVFYVLIVLFSSNRLSIAKVFTKCDLMKELINIHNGSFEDALKLVCLAQSFGFNTNYQNEPWTGIFGIRCENNFVEACNVSCLMLLDDEIENDLKCAERLLDLKNLNKTCNESFNNETMMCLQMDSTKAHMKEAFNSEAKNIQHEMNDSSTTPVRSHEKKTQHKQIYLQFDDESYEASYQIEGIEAKSFSIEKLHLIHNLINHDSKVKVNYIFLFL